MRALQYSSFGGPEALQWSDAVDPALATGDIIVKLEAAGLNYADIYRRQGRFTPQGPAPWIPGMEGAGTIVQLGPDGAAAGFAVGDKVAWCDNPNSNAELVAVAVEKLIPRPEAISAQLAASVLLQGLTAHYLVHDSHPLRAGDWAVVHAAGGGVGLLLTQIIKRQGGRVVALASSPEKQRAASDAGADVAIGYDAWIEQVHTITGKGADVVFDSVGTTIIDSLAATCVGGRSVFFGIAGGQPPVIEPLLLMERSLTITGGDLWNVLTTAEQRRSRAAELFGWMADGSVTSRVAGIFELNDGGKAHSFLESRSAIGKVLLVP